MASPMPIAERLTQFSASVECKLEAVRPVARDLRAFLEQQGATEEEVMSCELAFVEACNNAVLYANAPARHLPIEIKAACTDKEIEIKIQDHTAGFQLPDEVALPESEEEGGRGLFIIRSVMDEVSYRVKEGSNTMVLRKRRVQQVKTNGLDDIGLYKRKLAESEQVISEMAEELSSCYETLSAIFRCGAELGKTNNIVTFAESLCNDLLEITESDWYVLRVISEESSRLLPFVASRTSFPLEAQATTAATAEATAARSRIDLWFNPKKPLDSNDPLAQFGADCVGLVHPIVFADNLAGTLTVGKCAGRPSFTAAQANIVRTFADFLAIQFVNARLQEEQVAHKLVSRELDIAKSIQRALLPKTLPQPCNFELAGYCEFARTVGGDFYDVVPVGNSSLLLIIADVMGKGIPAAMFAAILRSVIRAAPEYISKPDALLQRVNRLLYEELSEVDMFITAQLVFVDFAKRELVTASAGHCPLLIGSAAAPGQTKAISPEGIPLGILPDANFQAQMEALPPDARLLLYTDGVTDARNAQGAFFSNERLLRWFIAESAPGTSAERMQRSLADELHSFQGESAPFDDQTFLVVAERTSTRKTDVPEDFSG